MTIVRCPPPLRDGDIVVRPHQPGDVAAFTRFVTDPEATRYLAFTEKQKSAAGARAMLDFVISTYGTEHEVVSLTIARTSDDAYLGAVGASPTDTVGVLEIYFTVLPEHQGRGLASRAASLLLDHLFSVPGIRSVQADVLTDNRASVRVLEKLGFRYERTVRRAPRNHGELSHVALSGARYVLDAAWWVTVSPATGAG